MTRYIAGLLTAWALLAEVRHSPNTRSLEPGEDSGKATLQDLAWLAGPWTGAAMGGEVEEWWSEPKGGVMLGAFRLTREGKPAFYELIAIREENETLILKLKHFHPDMKGWEERDQTVDFRFVAAEGKTAWFSGLTYRLTDPNTLDIYVLFRQKDGTRREEKLTLRRKP